MTLNTPLLQFPKLFPDSIVQNAEAKAKAAENTLGSVSLNDLIDKIVNGAIDLGIRIVIAIVVFYLGKLIINRLYKIVRTIMIKREFDRSLSTFILSLLKISLLFVLIVTVIGILGIETSSFIAIFASAGVAIGMALSGTLQNFAGGVLILFIKPYKIGDYVEFGGYAGTVKEIQIFSTIINTVDNKSIIIPNGQLSTGTINNYSREDYRRLEWTISIAYGDDIETARKTALEIIAADDRIVKQYREDDRKMRNIAETVENAKAPDADKTEPHTNFLKRIFSHKKRLKEKAIEWQKAQEKDLEAKLTKIDCSPYVVVGELADSSVNIIIRAWTRSEFYWSVFFSINEKIYTEFPKRGLNFPFPQMDVHLSKD